MKFMNKVSWTMIFHVFGGNEASLLMNGNILQLWQVGKFVQLASNFFGGFVIAFIKGWRLAVVLLACMPCVIIAGGFMSMMMAKMSSRGQVAYAEAGNVVDQTVGAIRTVRHLHQIISIEWVSWDSIFHCLKALFWNLVRLRLLLVRKKP